jgi:hypothetical protein
VLQLNPEIKDTDKIFPGQKIVLSKNETESNSALPTPSIDLPADTEKLQSEPESKPIQMENTPPWFVFLGASFNDYQQSNGGFATNGQWLTIIGSYHYQFSESLEASLGLDLTPFIFHESSNASSLYFLQSEFILTYQLPIPSNSWRFKLASGLYYTTTISKDSSLGYLNVFGFELGPVIQKRFPSGNQVNLLVNIAPVLNAASLDLSNREITAEIINDFAPNLAANYFSVLARYRTLQLQSAVSRLNLTSFTLGLGYHF